MIIDIVNRQSVKTCYQGCYRISARTSFVAMSGIKINSDNNVKWAL